MDELAIKFDPSNNDDLSKSLNLLLEYTANTLKTYNNIKFIPSRLVGVEPTPLEERGNNEWIIYIFARPAKGFLGNFKVSISISITFDGNSVISEKLVGVMDVDRGGNFKGADVSNKIINLFNKSRKLFIEASQDPIPYHSTFKADDEEDISDTIMDIVTKFFYAERGKYAVNITGKEPGSKSKWMINLKVLSVDNNGSTDITYRFSIFYNNEKVFPEVLAGRIKLYSDGRVDDPGVIEEIVETFAHKRKELISKTAKALKGFYSRKGLR